MTETLNTDVLDQIFGKEEEKKGEVVENVVQQEDEGQAQEIVNDSQAAELSTADSSAKKETPDTNKVDYGALKQERMRRKEIEAKFKEVQEKLAKYEQQTGQQVPVQPTVNADGEITFEKNPQEALRQASLLMYQKLNQLETSITERQQQEEARAQVNQLVTQYRETAKEFVQQNPDYAQAYNHLYKIKTAEFELMGMDKKQAEAAFVNWEMRNGYDAYQNEMNPHEMFYELAKRTGYTPAQVADAQTQQNSKLSIIKQGMQDNKALGNSKSLTSEAQNGTMAEDIIMSMNKRK